MSRCPFSHYVLAPLIFFGAAAGAHAAQLVINGDFTSDVQRWYAHPDYGILSWDSAMGRAQEAGVGRVTPVFEEYRRLYFGVISQCIPLPNGKSTYDFTAWTKHLGGGSSGASLYFYSNTQCLHSAIPYTTLVVPYSQAEGWLRFSSTFQPPATTQSLKVQISLDASPVNPGDFFVDSVSLIDVPKVFGNGYE